MEKSGELIIGQHLVKLGEKNRIALPKKIRNQLGNDIVLTFGFEKTILAVDAEKWERILTNITEASFLRENARSVKRFLLGGAQQVTCDSQGRFVIPEYLKAYAPLEHEIVCLGVGTHLELWNRKSWERSLETIQNNISGVAEKLIDTNDEF